MRQRQHGQATLTWWPVLQLLRAGNEVQMSSQPSGLIPPSGPERQQEVRHAQVALRSIGQPNSVASEFDFWNDRYEGRRLFSELLGTFFLVLVAVGGGMVNACFGGQAVPYGARVVAAGAESKRQRARSAAAGARDPSRVQA
jgi:hypothetical protein